MSKQNVKKVIDGGMLTDKEKLVAEFRFKELQQFEHLSIRRGILTIMLLSTGASFLSAIAVRCSWYAVLIESLGSEFVWFAYMAGLLFLAVGIINYTLDQVDHYICDMYTGLCESIKNGKVLDFRFKGVGFFEQFRYKAKYN